MRRFIEGISYKGNRQKPADLPIMAPRSDVAVSPRKQQLALLESKDESTRGIDVTATDARILRPNGHSRRRSSTSCAGPRGPSGILEECLDGAAATFRQL